MMGPTIRQKVAVLKKKSPTVPVPTKLDTTRLKAPSNVRIAAVIGISISRHHGHEIKCSDNCKQAKDQRHSIDDFISFLSLHFSLVSPVPFFLCCDWTGM